MVKVTIEATNDNGQKIIRVLQGRFIVGAVYEGEGKCKTLVTGDTCLAEAIMVLNEAQNRLILEYGEEEQPTGDIFGDMVPDFMEELAGKFRGV